MKKLTLVSSIILSLTLNTSIFADDGLLNFSNGLEAEAGMTVPGATRSFSVSITNQNNANDISSLATSFTNSEYGFLGGSFPGIGGDCASSLTSGTSCLLMLEHSPVSIGDSDSFLNMSYQLATDTLGSTHTFEALVDGHSAELEVAGCSSLSPLYSSLSTSSMATDTNSIVTVTGSNFSIATQVSISAGSVSNIEILNPSSLRFTINAPSSPGSADLSIQTECGEVVQVGAISYVAPTGGWNDLRTAAGVAVVDPKFTNAGINGINLDPTFGIQVDVSATNWNKYLKFDGVCDVVSKTFEIIVYRSGTNSRFMPSLINENTVVEPWPGTVAWQRQYIGLWANGGSVGDAYGSQVGEGGALWSQSFSNVTFSAGKYYKFSFQEAGQNSSLVEIHEVDASFNELSQLASFTSSKTSTTATSVCAGVIPNSAGLSDYFITAVRSF